MPSAVAALPATNTVRASNRAVRRFRPLVAAPRTGADTANVNANRVTNWPAAGMVTPRSAAIAGNRPAMTKLSVPTANVASTRGSSRAYTVPPDCWMIAKLSEGWMFVQQSNEGYG
ncbi:hypothetical protein GCM10028864_01800 [Microlunatus parietis]